MEPIQVGSQRVITLRYTMRNEAGEILADMLQQEPTKFVFGSGEILPGLEEPLTGLRIGERKTFSLCPDTTSGHRETYYFDVIIDDIRWVWETELGKSESNDCGPGCVC